MTALTLQQQFLRKHPKNLTRLISYLAFVQRPLLQCGMIKKLLRYKSSLLYLLLIPFVNWLFSWAPVFPLPDGGTWTPFTIITGLVLVFRDFSQREIGNKVLILLVVGVALSFLLAPPAIAIVSALAFAVSEIVDWVVYSVSKRPLHQRVVISSLFSAPVDSTLFLYGADIVVSGVLSGWSVLASVTSKILGALLVAYTIKRQQPILPRT